MTDALPCRPVMEELDNLPTMEETIHHLICRKTSGKDGIHPEVLNSGKPALLQHLHELLCLCWEKGYVPHDMHHDNILTLYKNKGDRNDYKTIVVFPSLASWGRSSHESSWHACSFKAGRSTMEMIFTLRQLQENCGEQRQPQYIAFIDLTKAFGLVSRSGLCSLLQKISCPPRLYNVVYFLPRGCKQHSMLQQCNLRRLPIQQWSEARLCPGTNSFGIVLYMFLQYAFDDSLSASASATE